MNTEVLQFPRIFFIIPGLVGTSDRWSEHEQAFNDEKENNGVCTSPMNRRFTLAGGLSSSQLRDCPPSGQKKNHADLNRLRDENKVLRAKVKEEGTLR